MHTKLLAKFCGHSLCYGHNILSFWIEIDQRSSEIFQSCGVYPIALFQRLQVFHMQLHGDPVSSQLLGRAAEITEAVYPKQR